MTGSRHWNLGSKLALVGAPFFLLGTCLIALTLWMSWQLDGGAAAVNEAGRLRMQTWRMVAMADQDPQSLAVQVDTMQRSLETLRRGDPERPLFMPWDDQVRASFSKVQSGWDDFLGLLQRPQTNRLTLQEAATELSARVDALVTAIESHLSVWTALLHLVQTAMLALAVLGAAVLLLAGYVFVLEPVAELKRAVGRMQQGDLRSRIEPPSSDEFGNLAEGFNQMAERLQSAYQGLEERVAAKTAELEEKNGRLQSLYEVSALASQANSVEELSKGFVQSLRRVTRADAVALRWTDLSQQRFVMLASAGLPEAMLQAERCLHVGDCACAEPTGSGTRVIRIHADASPPLPHCKQAGFATVISVPVRQHERPMGEIELFFHAEKAPASSERSLLEALAAHLASAMENLRLGERERESAVTHERNLMAQELHDSIAQSLAFLRIQVQLMGDALAAENNLQARTVLGEIDAGVRESYADVRELLLNFRTRSESEDIEPALAATLRKFEHQSGLRSSLRMEGHGLPLPPETQIQVLHILQESLSNVRKHARASHVWLDVQQAPCWRFEVRDNGIGFEGAGEHAGESHVGLRIMRERAARIDATVELLSAAGEGCSVVLTLAPLQPQVLAPSARVEHRPQVLH